MEKSRASILYGNGVFIDEASANDYIAKCDFLGRAAHEKAYEKVMDNALKTNKYQRQVSSTTIDVYDVLKAFEVNNPATAHAVKKLLASGKRGYKDVIQDLQEAIQSIERAIDLEGIK